MNPSPLEISNLRLRLRSLKASTTNWPEFQDLMDEISGLNVSERAKPAS